MNIRIKKISLGSSKTTIEFDKRINDEWENNSLSSPQMPLDEFVESMQELTQDVCKINEFNLEDAKDLIINGVSFSHGKDGSDYKVTITSKKEVALTNSPRNVSTPLFAIAELPEDDGNNNFRDELKAKLHNITEYAIKYVQGERQQLEQQVLDFDNGVKDEV